MPPNTDLSRIMRIGRVCVVLRDHFVGRFMERSGINTPEEAFLHLWRLLAKCAEVRLKERWRFAQMLKYIDEDSRYFFADGWILVASGTSFKTCYPATFDKWEYVRRASPEEPSSRGERRNRRNR